MFFKHHLLSASSVERLRPLRLSKRQGAAVAELAVSLPVLALLVCGSLQACSLIYLKHGLVSAAYQGTVELVRPTSSSASVVTRVEQILAVHEIKNANIELRPAGVEVSDLPAGTPVEIHVRADVNSNLAIAGWFTFSDQIEHSVVGPR